MLSDTLSKGARTGPQTNVSPSKSMLLSKKAKCLHILWQFFELLFNGADIFYFMRKRACSPAASIAETSHPGRPAFSSTLGLAPVGSGFCRHGNDFVLGIFTNKRSFLSS
jgi:hypothetical protein